MQSRSGPHALTPGPTQPLHPRPAQGVHGGGYDHMPLDGNGTGHPPRLTYQRPQGGASSHGPDPNARGSGYPGELPPHSGRGPYPGEEREVPLHIEKERERQAREAAEADEDEQRVGLSSVYDVLWPVAFWAFGLLQIGVAGKTSLALMGTYNWVDHLQVTVISTGAIAALIIVYKWVIQGSDGLPWSRRQEK